MILKRFNIVVLIFAGILLNFGCKKDWLDTKADKTQAVPSTLKDFQALLDQFAINSNANSLGEEASDGHYTSESAFSAAGNRAKNAYTWSHEAPYAFPNNTDWTGVYGRIYRTNIVLDGLNKFNPKDESSQEVLKDIKGQALFHRADALFWVAQVWSPPYLSASAHTDLGIPLKLESDINIPSVRSTVKQTYDQIISDLLTAKDLLPQVSSFKTRPGKGAAYALLARIYLSIEDYDKAWEFSDSSLHIHNTLLDFNTIPTDENFIGDFRTNPEVILHIQMNTTSATAGFLRSNRFIEQSLYNLYDDNDLRRILFFDLSTQGEISFKGNYLSTTRDLFCGLATDEMYLIRAECYARKGAKEPALQDLNTLMQKRWKTGTFIPLTAVNAAEALTSILIERKKELLLRGLRWTDLRRLNHEDRFKVTLTRTIGGQTYTLEPNSYRYTFPIPDDIIAISGMQQNPGW